MAVLIIIQIMLAAYMLYNGDIFWGVLFVWCVGVNMGFVMAKNPPDMW